MLIVPFYKPQASTEKLSPDASNLFVADALKSSLSALDGLDDNVKKLLSDVIDEHQFKGECSSKQVHNQYWSHKIW